MGHSVRDESFNSAKNQGGEQDRDSHRRPEVDEYVGEVTLHDVDYHPSCDPDALPVGGGTFPVQSPLASQFEGPRYDVTLPGGKQQIQP